MVVPPSMGVEQEDNSDDGSRHGHRNRCIPSGLGGHNVHVDIQTGGLWSDEKCMMHINCLELLGGAIAVKALRKASKHIHI